jgi:hypothetical protein
LLLYKVQTKPFQRSNIKRIIEQTLKNLKTKPKSFSLVSLCYVKFGEG